jgi:hypothetical protein
LVLGAPYKTLVAGRPLSELLLHNFPENGVKFLLHHPDNLQDLVRLLALRYHNLPDANRFDFSRRTIEPDTLIRADFSHGITDLLVRLPLQTGKHAADWVKLYLLFEHLSGHQRHIVPRSLAYAMDAYRLQERRWLQRHANLQGLLYEAVIPIVIYTGERTWQAPTPFHELVQGGTLLAPFIPATEPLFLSLPGQAEHELVDQGGALGVVLHLLQQRHATAAAFHELLVRAVGLIQERAPRDRHRLVELLAYLTALVYHFRNERASLREELERSIKQPPVRKEIRAVGRTLAEALREEGAVEAKQQTLILLLRRKFGRKLTTAVTGVIQGTRDLPTLDEWLGNVLDAGTLDEVGIPGRS